MEINNCRVISIGDNQCVLMVNAKSSERIYIETMKCVVEKVFSLQTPSNICEVSNVFEVTFIISVSDAQDIDAKLLSDVDNAFGCICNITEHIIHERRKITSLKEDIKYV